MTRRNTRAHWCLSWLTAYAVVCKVASLTLTRIFASQAFNGDRTNKPSDLGNAQIGSNVKHGFPPSITKDYTIDRNITVKSDSWISESLPLQVYRGARVPPRKRLPVIDLSDSVHAAFPSFSKSSDFLLEKLDSLSHSERRSLQMKIAAEARASLPLDPRHHLHILYCDEHICVVNKPSGILSVPGPRRNPSIANLVYEILNPPIDIDQMVVHRIDMDTSGVLVFALTELALRQLHDDFRSRRVKKTYEALLAGHFRKATQVEIDVALERDPYHPPFMRVAQTSVRVPANDSDIGNRKDQPPIHVNFRKFINQAPKPSLSTMTAGSLEYLLSSSEDSLPVSRVHMSPHTGRTHQLRVHAAALGYPIIGDDIYGFEGEGDCGVNSTILDQLIPNRMSLHQQLQELQLPLCLHAKQLCMFHPFSGAPMIFECAAPF